MKVWLDESIRSDQEYIPDCTMVFLFDQSNQDKRSTTKKYVTSNPSARSNKLTLNLYPWTVFGGGLSVS